MRVGILSYPESTKDPTWLGEDKKNYKFIAWKALCYGWFLNRQ